MYKKNCWKLSLIHILPTVNLMSPKINLVVFALFVLWLCFKDNINIFLAIPHLTSQTSPCPATVPSQLQIYHYIWNLFLTSQITWLSKLIVHAPTNACSLTENTHSVARALLCSYTHSKKNEAHTHTRAHRDTHTHLHTHIGPEGGCREPSWAAALTTQLVLQGQ